ncbi:uncharacterized protein LOC144702554 [Wolffia australiana]
MFLKQKANKRWLAEGDHNTKYFHMLVNAREKRDYYNIRENYDHDQQQLENAAMNFYQNLVTSQPRQKDQDLLEAIPSTLSAEDNIMLCKPPDMTEIFEILASMNRNSVPGPDGFAPHFFTFCGHIIQNDVQVKYSTEMMEHESRKDHYSP